MVGIMRAVTVGQYLTLDEFRHVVERLDPVRNLQSSYYEHRVDGGDALPFRPVSANTRGE
jgi:hypothetical protein